MTTTIPDTLRSARYALLRSYRRDGTPVDTPIWFTFDGDKLVFRTKIGPKTKRLKASPWMELTPCDHRGRVIAGATAISGVASVLSGAAAEESNRSLHARYGWQWNVVPLLKIPGVTNVHSGLPLREKWRRATDRRLWSDCAIVEVDLRAGG